MTTPEASPRTSTGHTPRKAFDLFGRFNTAKDLMEEPAFAEDATTAIQAPVLTVETKARLSDRGKRMSEGDVPTIDEDLEKRERLETPFAAAPETGRTERLSPWIREHGYNPNKWVGLHQEVCDFIQYIRPTDGEMELRQSVVNEISEICLRIWPTCMPRTFGSMNTQLLLPTSDIDICVSNVTEDVQTAITAIAEAITTARLCSSALPRVIRNTRVPLVKFTHAETGFSVDLSVNAEEGVANTEIVRELLNFYPAAFPLVILVKFFLQRRRMHETYFGGMGSYGTTLLVLSFLQHHPYNLLGGANRGQITLGMLLADFLRYYGSYFNFTNVGISVQNGGSYYRKKPNDSRGLVVQDPSNPENNVGTATRHFPSIARSMEAAHVMLLADSGGVVGDGTRLSRLMWMTRPEVERREQLVVIHSAWVRKHQPGGGATPTLPPKKVRRAQY